MQRVNTSSNLCTTFSNHRGGKNAQCSLEPRNSCFLYYNYCSYPCASLERTQLKHFVHSCDKLWADWFGDHCQTITHVIYHHSDASVSVSFSSGLFELPFSWASLNLLLFWTYHQLCSDHHIPGVVRASSGKPLRDHSNHSVSIVPPNAANGLFYGQTRDAQFQSLQYRCKGTLVRTHTLEFCKLCRQR